MLHLGLMAVPVYSGKRPMRRSSMNVETRIRRQTVSCHDGIKGHRVSYLSQLENPPAVRIQAISQLLFLFWQ